jgi:hypothetical protein
VNEIILSCLQLQSIDFSSCEKIHFIGFVYHNDGFIHYANPHADFNFYLNANDQSKYHHELNVLLANPVLHPNPHPNLRNLIDVHLNHNQSMHYEAIMWIITANENLHSLSLNSVPCVTDEIVLSALQGCKQLRELSISNCSTLSNISFLNFSTFPNPLHIMKLNLSHIGFGKALLNTGLRAILQSCPELIELDVSRNYQLTDDETLAVHSELSYDKMKKFKLNCQFIPKLQRFNLAHCNGLTDEGVALLLNSIGNQLVHLNLNGVTSVGDVSFGMIGKLKIFMTATLSDRFTISCVLLLNTFKFCSLMIHTSKDNNNM